jgi:Ca-activated chloride channel family protein
MPAAAQQAAAGEGSAGDAIRLRRDMVTLNVMVRDADGRCITGLKKSNFAVFDEKVRQEVTFFSAEDVPLTLGIVFDVSGSMKEKMTAARRALAGLLERSHREDEIFVIGVDERVTLVRDFTPNVPSIANAFMLGEARGRTALFDGAVAAIEKCKRGSRAKRAVLIVSDGQDNASRYTLAELAELLRESDVMVYAVGVLDLAEDRQRFIAGAHALDRLAALTGGVAYFPFKEEELSDVCAQIALELRRHYSIGFYPSRLDGDGKYRRLRVKVERPAGLPPLRAEYRDGYFDTRR